MVVTSASEKQTERIGMSLAAQLRPGDVLLLRGDLGAGKSVLSRGIARGLGITGPIPSPTFTLLNCYQGMLSFHHFDLYRLDDPEEFFAAGLQDFLEGESVSVVEWPERCEEAIPPCHLEISISNGLLDGDRVFTILGKGSFHEVKL